MAVRDAAVPALLLHDGQEPGHPPRRILEQGAQGFGLGNDLVDAPAFGRRAVALLRVGIRGARRRWRHGNPPLGFGGRVRGLGFGRPNPQIRKDIGAVRSKSRVRGTPSSVPRARPLAASTASSSTGGSVRPSTSLSSEVRKTCGTGAGRIREGSQERRARSATWAWSVRPSVSPRQSTRGQGARTAVARRQRRSTERKRRASARGKRIRDVLLSGG